MSFSGTFILISEAGLKGLSACLQLSKPSPILESVSKLIYKHRVTGALRETELDTKFSVSQ